MPKAVWHIYSLQGLAPEKFVDVYNKILKGDYISLSTMGSDEPCSPFRSMSFTDEASTGPRDCKTKKYDTNS